MSALLLDGRVFKLRQMFWFWFAGVFLPVEGVLYPVTGLLCIVDELCPVEEELHFVVCQKGTTNSN